MIHPHYHCFHAAAVLPNFSTLPIWNLKGQKISETSQALVALLIFLQRGRSPVVPSPARRRLAVPFIPHRMDRRQSVCGVSKPPSSLLPHSFLCSSDNLITDFEQSWRAFTAFPIHIGTASYDSPSLRIGASAHFLAGGERKEGREGGREGE